MQNSQKLSLKGYYEGLPKPFSPKQNFLEEVQRRCGNVTMTTVRNWVLYGRRPNNPVHKSILSELTGIKEEELWTD